MARRTAILDHKPIGEINLTPLMDLTFILLITFIITFPLLEQGLSVNLPQATGDALDPGESVEVTVDAQGTWHIEQRAVSPEQFAVEMRYLRAHRPDALILLRGDAGLPYGKLMSVMHVLRKEGVSRISLVSQSGEPVSQP